jgi:3-methyladenine DNA glycosylase AlkD
MKGILKELREELAACSDEKVKQSSARFFKEAITLHGVKSTDVQRIDKGFYARIKDEGKDYVLPSAMSSGQHHILKRTLSPATGRIISVKNMNRPISQYFERWLGTYVTNWATCDTLCNHTIGDLVTKYPGKIEELKRWALSPNRWMRRGAAVSLIVPARKGLFLPDVFEIATILLHDSDDMVQKGYGWMLKVASQAHQHQVYGYVMHHRATMPRTALRYAIEKMPPALRSAAMEKP